MWPLSPRSSDIVGIQITDKQLRFSRIQHNSALYKLVDYYEQPLDRNEIINGIPYKIPQIATYINNFVASHKLRRPLLTYALDDAWLNPHIETSIRTDNKSSNIISQHQLTSLAWYTVEIAREQLFYYQLISLQLSMACDVITTANAAALTALNALSPTNTYAFNNDIDCNEYIHSACKAAPFNRIDRNNRTIPERALATALGLYVQGSENL